MVKAIAMIPWMREKFAERRARWLAARGKRNEDNANAAAAAANPNAVTTTTSARLQEPMTIPMQRRQLVGPNASTTSLELTPTHRQSAGTAIASISQPGSRRDVRYGLTRRIPTANTTASASCLASDSGCNVSSSSTGMSGLVSKAASNCTSKIMPKCKLKNRPSSETLVEPAKSEDETRIRVRIICPSGRVLAYQTTPSKRLTELKNEILLELSDDPVSLPLFAADIRSLSHRFRLVRAEYAGAELNESLTLLQLSVLDNDSLVLMARRNNIQQIQTQIRETQPPNEIQIERATMNLTPRRVNMATIDINEIFQQSNIQFDVRKVLISLSQASAIIIGAGPYAPRLITMLKQKLVNKRNYQNDTIQCLIDMGFSGERAEYALKLHNNVYSATLEWLIMHQNEPDSNVAGPGGITAIQKSDSTISASQITTSDTDVLANTEALLEIVRIYSHRDIPPSEEAVVSLKEMGFQEADILVALKKTCNNKAAACEWLCGNRSGSLIELRDGLAQDSPILKTILEMHQVQYNLSNPKIFLAFLAILENENALRIWSGDNDTSSVITNILQKYHEEKHVLGINQFYNQQ